MRLLARRLGGFGALLALGAVFGWLGPYGTYELGLFERFAYWMIAIPVIGLLAPPATRLIERLEPVASLSQPMRTLAGSLIAGIPGAFIAIGLQTLFGRPPLESPIELARIYVSVTVLIALIAIPMGMIAVRRRQATAAPAAAQPIAAPPAAAPPIDYPFLRRIPPKLGTNLLFIATEDHYLRVTTDRGSDLILFRLSDAVAELDPAAGQQVHRSYWVAWRAITAVQRDGHRTALLLSNGTTIPVSRTYARSLRKSGRLAG